MLPNFFSASAIVVIASVTANVGIANNSSYYSASKSILSTIIDYRIKMIELTKKKYG